LGLVDELVAPDSLASTAREIADAIALNSPIAVSRSLEALWGSLELPLDEAMERGWEMVKRHRSHPDAREGPRAFMEKRPPVWES
jgi:enoyl-CoA hydratase/carnithine racemase